MNDVALGANDVLRNDVGLRPMMSRFASYERSECFISAQADASFRMTVLH